MFNQRASGILVHPTSFPSPYGIGDLGQGAFDFIDFLKAAKQTLWQVLPLGPTGYGDSPYQSFSSFAGNHYLISPYELKKEGLLTDDDLQEIPAHNPRQIDYGQVIPYKISLLQKAYENFKTKAALKTKATKFANANKYWLDDYALFAALKDNFGGKEWSAWPANIRDRDPKTMAEMTKKLENGIGFYKFLQYEFFRQWDALKKYANKANIQIIGDIPIFVAGDSSDVWANPELYELDAAGKPTAVAGVPPDYFNELGQLWGNPLYKWNTHKETDYAWWVNRIAATMKMVDIVRLDHFIGFEQYWSVPAGSETAIHGKWLKGPGKPLFMAVKSALGSLPLIAEDLGEVTEKVEKLRISLKLPGMKILQFAFDEPDAAYLPHNYPDNLSVVYAGTHDNDTTVGWYHCAPERSKDFLRRYLNVDGYDVAWDLIRLALSSTAVFAITQIQDIMSLPTEDRMNNPGTASAQWTFRYTADMLRPELANRLKYLTEMFNR